MSRLGMRVSWIVIVASALFIAGYLVRCGRQAEGRLGAPVSPVASQPGAGRAVSEGQPRPALRPTERQAGPRGPTAASPQPSARGAAGGSPAPETAVSAGTAPPYSATPVSAAPGRLPPPPQPGPGLAPPEQASRIQMKETTFDFGEIYQFEEVTHEFAFTNTGRSALAFGAITASCGCAVVTPSKKEYAAGEQGTIKVVFNALRYRDRVSKHIYVDTNDPVTPRVILTMSGVVKVEVEVTPTGVYTGRLKVGDSLERTLTITPVEVKTLKILEIKTDHPLLTAEAQPMADQSGAYQVRVRFGPAEKAERINAKVILRTDLPHTKELSISVFGRVQEGEATDAPPAK